MTTGSADESHEEADPLDPTNSRVSGTRSAPEEPSTPWKVLVFPGGTEIGLEIQRSLAQCPKTILFSASQDVPNHAPFVFRKTLCVPSVHEAGYVDALNRVLDDHRIDFIYPAHDDVLFALACDAERIRAKIVTSPAETCAVSRSKSFTYQRLSGAVKTPRVFNRPEDVDQFPIFAKPDRGQGSQRTFRVNDQDSLHALCREHADLILSEYLPGEEFTVDCFSHRNQGLLYCEARRRIRTRSGISMSSAFAPDLGREPREIAEAIGTRLAFHGAWFFQLKRDAAGALRLLEVAPRIAGTMALSRVRGVNFALLSLYEQLGFPLRLLVNPPNVTIDRALVNRYRLELNYAVVYVDLDDTLVIRDRVNTRLVAFLYQCLNEGKRLVLLTRHRLDVQQTLRRYRLTSLFDEVIHLTRDEKKSAFIPEPDAILIDDSFRERDDAVAVRGILTFDCGMIEALIDERE
jgi:carbamoyl-phosphate synthase large subunit